VRGHVLVVGGTEFFGKRAVERFLEEGWRLTVLSRGQRRPAWWDRVEHILCDRTDRAAFAQVLAGRTFDVVVDNIAYDAEDVTSALQTLRGVTGHYVLTSTGAVYDPPPEDRLFSPVREEDATLGVRPDDAPYGAGKKRAERTLLDGARDLPFTVVRPTVVPGTGGDTTTLVDYLRTAARVLRRDLEIVRVPQTVLRTALSSYRPPYSRRFVLDITRAVAELGYAPTAAVRWIRWTVEDFAGAVGLPPSAGYADRAAELDFARAQLGVGP